MSWNIVLYGCFGSRGREYDFDVLAPEDLVVGRLVRDAGLLSPSWFAGFVEGRAFFGRRATVASILGPDHVLAKDSRRALEFVFAYASHAGETLPSWREFQAFEAQLACDLRNAADLAMASSAPVARSIAASVPRFSGASASGRQTSFWDDMVAGLLQEGVAIVIADAAGQSATKLVPVAHAARGRSDHRSESERELDELIRKKGKPKRRGGCAFLLGCIGTVSILASALQQPVHGVFSRSSDRSH